ncbi:MAG: hypothetical protein KDK25_03550 [Leptospiraceae bacterium]|nr:hypothetical protein [Leptospiraceae bacterium]
MRKSASIRIVHGILWALALVAFLSCFLVLIGGATNVPVLGFTFSRINVAIGLKLDALSTILFFMITLLAAAIARFAIRYLDGEERQWYFYRYLLLTVVGVSLFVLSSNLLMLFASWLLTSYGLHQLLLFYPERAEAINAARKKALISRLGDLALIAGIALVYDTFRSFEFDRIFAIYESWPAYRQVSGRMEVIMILFVTGAMIKSAQFPFHFWLPDTMATPTPVSAMMHAGIINAGGFLMIRLSPLLESVQAGPALLIIAGAMTSVYGALSMITQNNIKRKLGYSTISQMGMMLFACGLGAYGVALFHIFAHSFYKAHAFLSTGALVDEARKTGFKLSPISPFGILLGLAGVAGLVYGAFTFKGGALFPYFIYGSVLWLGFVQNSGVSPVKYSRIRVWAAIWLLMLVALALYGIIEHGLGQYLMGITPDPATASGLSVYSVSALAGLSFFVVGLLLTRTLQRSSSFSRRLYAYLLNGGYFSAASDRFFEKNTPVVRGGQV